ncbi:MAG: cobalt-precorrin-6A reductase [Actinomycetota bacterium]|nr:cobalt-precorrin-6A reductase [Actinomycetota bacterium]
MRVLILGGTGEARALAGELATRTRFEVTSSLAGRVSNPALPVGNIRLGGFGGSAGLLDYLREQRMDAVVDATHPFAATISRHAAEAAAAARRPLLALRRPGWTQAAGDHWVRVADIATAASTVSRMPPGCLFVTTGRRDLEAFANDDQHDYLVRTVDPPSGPVPARMTLLLDRGPFTLVGETDLLSTHQVTALVTKDSGGQMTAAKLLAARNRSIPVVMVERPPLPAAVNMVETVADAVTWLDRNAS